MIRWATWANLLTAARLLLALPCAAAAAAGWWGTAAVLLTVGIATDLLDGPLARRMQQSSAMGGLLDHGTDALFVALLLGGLALQDRVPGLLAPLVLVAFAQYALDSRSHRGRPLRASRLGRYNGVAYFVLAGLIVYREALMLSWPSGALTTALAWLLIATTAFSMVDRLVASLRG